MEPLVFIAKSASILAIFYGVYILFLRKDTLFQAKRVFFLVGIIAAIGIPFLQFNKTIYIDPPAPYPSQETPNIETLISLAELQASAENQSNEVTPIIESSPHTPIQKPINWLQIAFIIYLIGIGILLIRFIIQSFSLLCMLKKYPHQTRDGYRYIQVVDTVSPFSIFKYIVFNPSLHSEEELRMILKHEQEHARQWHSIDMLFGQLITILQWANPFSWLYKKGMEANLEYMADSYTIHKIASKKQYQLTLVKASSPLIAPALTSPFYQSLIKKRIIMLNKRTSKKRNLFKTSIVLPVLALFMLSFNVSENYEYKTVTDTQLIITSASSQSELTSIKNTINETSSNFEVDFADIKRNTKGKLTQLKIATKFREQDRFNKVVSYGGNLKNINPIQLEVVKDQLQISNLESETIMRVTAKGVTSSLFTKQGNNTFTPLGKNPLYIINNKEYRKQDLPKQTTTMVHSDKITIYNKGEESEKYGAKGEDGVIVFNGNVGIITNANPINDIAALNLKNPFEFKINKDTTEEELKAFKQKLLEEGVSFDYTTKRNSNNEIIALTIKYDDRKGNNTSYSISDDEPIASIYFYNNETGLGIGHPKDQFHLKEILERDELEEEIEREVARAMAMEERIGNLAKRKEAIVIKKAKMEEHRAEMKEKMAEVKERLQENREEIRAQLADHHIKIRKKKRVRFNKGKNGTTIFEINGNEPLYIINGRIISKDALKEIDPDKITSVNVLKDLKAITKYGSEGKNGAIEIILDDHNIHINKDHLEIDGEVFELNGGQFILDNNKFIFDSNKLNFDDIHDIKISRGDISDIHINKNTSDTQLEKITSKFKKEGIDVSFKKVKRNVAGKLTRIKVKVTGNGINQTSYAKTDDDTPIDDINLSF